MLLQVLVLPLEKLYYQLLCYINWVFGWRPSWGAYLILVLISIIIKIPLTHEELLVILIILHIEFIINIGLNMMYLIHGLWPMIFAIVVHSMFLTIFFFQQVTLGMKIIGPSQFAMYSIYTFASIIFTFLTGYIIDKFGVRTVLPYYQIPGVGFSMIFKKTQFL